MAYWVQNTVVEYFDGHVKNYKEPKTRDENRMIELLLQMHLLRNAGEKLNVDAVIDDDYNLKKIICKRSLEDRFVTNTFEKK